MIAIYEHLVCNSPMSESHKEVQMTAKFFTHPFDARSVMLFASIAVTSAMAHAQPLPNASQRAANGANNQRVTQVDRHLNPGDPRRHLVRQPVKKNM